MLHHGISLKGYQGSVGIQNHIQYEKPNYDYVTHPLLTQKANACISSQIPNTQLYTAGIVSKEQSSPMAR
jgi:hypothetical protein